MLLPRKHRVHLIDEQPSVASEGGEGDSASVQSEEGSEASSGSCTVSTGWKKANAQADLFSRMSKGRKKTVGIGGLDLAPL
jgi:hypothetical protein